MHRITTLLAGLLIGAPALAADLTERSAPPVIVPPAFTWTGLYAGVNVGYGFAADRARFDPVLGATTKAGGGDGVLGGAQLGYNYQFTPGSGVVVGLEGDVQGAALGGGRASAGPALGASPALDYFGTLRGRVGYAFDRLLVYGTGGLAYGGGSRSAAVPAFARPRESGLGYAAGGGIEYALTTRLSAKIEALYVSIDRSRSGTAVDPSGIAAPGLGRARDDFSVVRAGLNYRF